MSNPLICLIDGRYILYRSHFAMPSLSYNGTPTSAIFGFVKTIKTFYEHYGKETQFLVCWDSPGDTYRKTIYPEYKANRHDNKNAGALVAVNTQCDMIMKSEAFTQWAVSGFEADDLIASFCLHFHAQASGGICIISKDKDLYSSLHPGVFMQSSIDKPIFTADDMANEYNGVTTDLWPLVKAIAGDKSDNIPGIKGYAEKRASKAVCESIIVESIIANKENRAIVERNLQLVSPMTSLTKWPAPRPLDLTKFNMFCSQYAMISAAIDADLQSIGKAVRQQAPGNYSYPGDDLIAKIAKV